MRYAGLLVHDRCPFIHTHHAPENLVKILNFVARATRHLGDGHVGGLQRASYQRLLRWAVGRGEATGAAVLIQRTAMQHHRSLAARKRLFWV